MVSLKSMLRLFVAASLFVTTSMANADGLPGGVTYTPPPPETTVTGTSGPSQNSAALGSQANNDSASGTAAGIGAGLIAAGTAMLPNPPTAPMGAMLIAMGILALMQSGANKGAAGQHGQNAGLNQDYTSTPDPTRDLGNSAAVNLGQKAAELKKLGINYDTKAGKFTLPNGKSFNLSDVSNPSAMSDLGVTAAQYKEAMDMAKKAEKKAAADAAKYAFDNPSGGGGGAGGGPLRNPAEEEAAVGTGKILPKADGNVAGMTRNFNGDRIGVAGDDIFAMMARRYKEKDNKETFLTPDAAPDASL